MKCISLLIVSTLTTLRASEIIVAPNGAWTWFNDERAVIVGDFLYAGYVKSDGRVAVSHVDLRNKTRGEVILSSDETTQSDDHNNPSLVLLPDKRILALYSLHDKRAMFHSRVSNVPLPTSSDHWGNEVHVHAGASNSYCNAYLLKSEQNRIYNFHRALNWNPTLSISDDLGSTWTKPRHFIKSGFGRVRPYPRLSSNGADRIDLIYTDGHPRNVKNSIYHMYYHKGALHHTNGTKIKNLAELPLVHEEGERGTVVYQYSDEDKGQDHDFDQWIPGGNAWSWDVHLDSKGNPVCVFSVKVTAGDGNWKRSRIFYYYAKWNGSRWTKSLIATAGRPLYHFEDDYAAGIALDPSDPSVVYLASNAKSPFEFESINEISLNEDDRYELWKGVTSNGGRCFRWTPVTQNSKADNLRPHVTTSDSQTRALIWFRGVYDTYTKFKTEIVARIL